MLTASEALGKRRLLIDFPGISRIDRTVTRSLSRASAFVTPAVF